MTAFQGNIKNVPRNIFIMLITIGIFAIVVILSMSFTVANTVDNISAEKSKRIVIATYEGILTNIANLTQDYSDWNAAYEWIIARDEVNLYEGIGTGAADTGFFDKIVIYDSNAVPLYAYDIDGTKSDIKYAVPTVADEYIAAVYQTEYEVIDLPPEPEIISGVELIDGQLAIVSASRVLPDPLGDVNINTLPVLISLVWLDDAFENELIGKTLQEQLQISTVIDNSIYSFPLFNLEGEQIASIKWKIEKPSAELLSRIGGYIAFLSIFFLIITFAIGRISANQTKAYMDAHSQARVDPLTGLLNRTGLTETINGKTVKEDMNAGRMAILYLDIDKFKHINDQYGHDTGDAALCKVADRLQFAVRSSDHIARLGGDEFIVVIIDDNPEDAALKACERLIADAEHVVHINSDTSLHLHLSIGIALSGQNTDWRSLIIKADSAMYEAKKSGSGYKFADKALIVKEEPVKTKSRESSLN